MTPFADIYSIAKVVIKDFRVDNLAKLDDKAFCEYMRSLLITGMPEFNGCLQSLDYHSEDVENTDKSETEKVWYFNNDLTQKEKSILAKTIVYTWWDGEVQTTEAYGAGLTYREFKKDGGYAQLKQQSEYKDKLLENISQSISDYQLQNLSSLPFFGGK